MFQLTPSQRATEAEPVNDIFTVFQLTPSQRATLPNSQSMELWFVSTHALTEGDVTADEVKKFKLVSTHALTEGDQSGGRVIPFFYVFQLTPSQRATVLVSTHRIIDQCFNSRPHRGRHDQRKTGTPRNVSTHALTEGDFPAEAACVAPRVVSTHALTEGDEVWQLGTDCLQCFNSRPHRGRRWTIICITGN